MRGGPEVSSPSPPVPSAPHPHPQKVVSGALRWVAAGFKISIGLALVGAFIGEFVISEAGLGHYILTAGSLYEIPRVLFGVALLSLLALGLAWIVWLVERWRPYLFVR